MQRDDVYSLLFIPNVTYFKTVVQYHNQDIFIRQDRKLSITSVIVISTVLAPPPALGTNLFSISIILPFSECYNRSHPT